MSKSLSFETKVFSHGTVLVEAIMNPTDPDARLPGWYVVHLEVTCVYGDDVTKELSAPERIRIEEDCIERMTSRQDDTPEAYDPY